MTDYFALFGEPRRAWLDVELLKKKFHALSADAHPDRVHGSSEPEKKSANERYTQLNSAYQCLASPRERLRHLIELETGGKPTELDRVPQELMDSFMVIAELLRGADKFIAEKEKSTSPLLQVQLFERAQEWIERLGAVEKKLGDARQEFYRELQGMNSFLLPRLEEIYRLLGFYDRWLKQLQERRVRLLV